MNAPVDFRGLRPSAPSDALPRTDSAAVISATGIPIATTNYVASVPALLAVLAVVLLALPARAATLVYAEKIIIQDGAGRQVGSAWPTGHAGILYAEFRIGSRPVIVALGADGFGASFLRFSEPGCAGPPMVGAFEGELYPYTAVAGPRSTVYIQSGPVAVRTTRSTLTSDGVCIDHEPFEDFMAILKATSTNLADHFVPPFTIRTIGRTPVPPATP
jgi:hypothetical protein